MLIKFIQNKLFLHQIKNYLFAIVLILIVIIFNLTLVKEAITSFTSTDVFISDGLLTEFLSENAYQNLITGKNLFSLSNSLVYPFQINTALNDPNASNALFFLFLRSFFTSYVSTILIVLLQFFLSGILIYKLLRSIKIRSEVSFLISLSFTFMPFMSHRVLGHYSYTAHYLFPLAYLLIINFFNALKSKLKIVYSILFGLSMAWALMANPYYFFSLVISYVLFLIYYLVFKRRILWKQILEKWQYTLLAAAAFIVVLIPWLAKVYETYLFQEPTPTVGIGSSITLSADLISFITPSYYNPIYKFIFIDLLGSLPHSTRVVNFYTDSWNRFAYPGLIFIFSGLSVVFFRKKIPSKIKTNIYPFLFVTTGFVIMTLGPFLKVFNKWAIIIDEGIAIFLPLPYLIIHYIPFLNGLRAPMRFTPAYVFFGLIGSAFLINYLFSKLNKKYVLYFTIGLFLLFLVDQNYQIPNAQDQNIPTKIYQYIKADKSNSTVLEIPYTLRDGLRYIGFVHAIEPLKGTLIYNKSTMGGYLPRIQPYTFSYYEHLLFMNYIASITDKGNYNPFRQKPGPLTITEFSSTNEDVTREVDFFDIEYIILKNDEEYSNIIRTLISEVGFDKILTEQNTDLYYRKSSNIFFSEIDFGSREDYLYVIDGLSESSGNYRKVTTDVVRLFVKPQNTRQLTLVAKSTKSSEVKVYLNKVYIGKILLKPGKQEYKIPIEKSYSLKIDEVIFKFQKNDINDVKLYSLTVN